MKKALVIYNPMAGAKKLINSEQLIRTTLKKKNIILIFL